MTPHQDGHSETVKRPAIQVSRAWHSQADQFAVQVFSRNAGKRHGQDGNGIDLFNFENSCDATLHCKRFPGARSG